jgi:hypothetical protein
MPDSSIVIRTGGQTGVDRAALLVAIELGIPYEGWCPRDGRADDRQTPPGLLGEFPNLRPTPSTDRRQRTAWNVRDADATLILSFYNVNATSAGSDFTTFCAEMLYEKPIRTTNVAEQRGRDDIPAWLDSLRATVGDRPLVLNVAGPREIEMPGIQAAATRYLRQLLRTASVVGARAAL